MKRCAVAACLVAAYGSALADASLGNEAVLERFAQATGQVGRVEADADGGVRIVWESALSVDLYRRRVDGPPLLTPYRSGTFGQFEFESDRRETAADGRLRWLRFGAGLADDTAVLPTSRARVRHLSVGEAGQQHRWAVGDVPVEHSALGVYTPLRGVLAEAFVGASTFVSFSAGTLAESWEALADDSWRTLRRRDVATLMLSTPVTNHVQAYATVQGFADAGSPGRFAERFGWAPSDAAPASGRSGTAGFRWRDGPWSAQGEFGLSQWKEQGQERRSDQALVVDLGWDGSGLNLRAGHHAIGRYFAMVSSLAASGVGETYANLNWNVTERWGLTLDVRRSRNELSRPPVPPPPITIPPTAPVAPTPQARDVDTVHVASRYGVVSVPGLVLTASVGRSRAVDDDALGPQRIDLGGVAGQWARDGWSAGLGWQHTRLDNGALALAGQRGDLWTANLGRSLSDARGDMPATWHWSAQLSGQWQRQRLDTGARVDTDTAILGLHGERASWGRVGLTVGGHRGNDALGNDVRTQWVQFEGVRPLAESTQLKLYLRDGRLRHGPLYEYHEQLYGVQLSHRF